MDGDLHMLDVVLKRDETLVGSNRTNSIEIVEQITNINNQINMINKAPASDIYKRTEANELFDNEADKTDLDEYYSKSETNAKVEVYNKTEVDKFLDEKANVVTSYSKSENDALLLLKADKTELNDSYSKSEDDALLNNNADIGVSYTKSENDALILLKADKTQLIDSYSKSEDDALLLLKADKTQLIDSYSKFEDGVLILAKTDKTDIENYVDLSSAQTITGQKQFGIVSERQCSKFLEFKIFRIKITSFVHAE
ncbi:MAG: hypothetical protein EZS28_012125 [Streblomastix strix]|uniref:Uncharacterized protein n=1 Tax=Streblomastix strix TaxID=222440 RepID=A0A5J4WCF5_9EUKA|nr:MAG: hypothetical protein EZS28_012125 [Streblomastix strix]